MHIKFLDHGKGSAAHASAYVLDQFDHQGNLRAGVHVLRGDATTFNAVCDSSPHLWKYTSGVVAWSKVDDPTDEQIQEVLNDFEKHAFAGLDQSQYHLFAVLHTDDDGSKHIHVLVPRLDLQSGKSLNIAPPGHEKHFDALRDYFNLKNNWSRPDDLLLMRTTQEPNHIVKLNKQAKKILSSQELENLPKKQFCQAMDNYVQTLLKTQTAANRADIVACLKQLDGIDSIKPSKDFLTVTLSSGKKHRLKGDFYNEKFEIGSYSEHLRAAAENRATANELAATLTDADQLRATYRAKREAYHQQHHAFTQRTADDNSPRAASTLDFDRDKESITPSNTNAHNELYGANTSIKSTAIEYRYIEHQNRHNQHRFVFNIHAGTTGRNQQPSPEPQYRSKELTEQYPRPGPTSNSKPKRTNPERHPDRNPVSIAVASSQAHDMGSYSVWSADAFNELIYNLSVQYELKNNQRPKRNDPAKFAVNTKPNQLLEQHTEISDADRNRPVPSPAKRIIESTKQIVSGTKRLIDATSRLIKERLELLRQAESRLEQQNQQLGNRERNEEGINFSDEIGAFKTRTRQIFRGISAKIIKQLEQSISSAMDESLAESGFNRHAEEYRARRNEERKDTAHDRTLESVADACTTGLQRRNRNTNLIGKQLKYTNEECHELGREIDRLAAEISKIRPKPKPAKEFKYLRGDAYYPDYALAHQEFSAQQDYAYQHGRKFDVIHIISRKSKKLNDYMNRARNMLNQSDYELIEKIIKNDERMLKNLKCDVVLEPQNSRFKDEISAYKACLDNFESMKSTLEAVKSPKPNNITSQPSDSELRVDQSLDPELANTFNFESP
ncbi:hypothetical protein ABLU18_14325 [Acinetobacter junii]|uniref:relaxase/mobilization nuclease domain-containing protein n=2 Tax=Acinetobacter TaxID=469 RepID=UPI0032B36EA9